MKGLQIIVLLGLLVTSITSCKDKCKDGEGDKFIITRNFNNFHTFQLDIPATIDLNHDTTLSSSSIDIFGQKNVIRSLETSISEGIVTVSFSECFNKHDELRFTLNTPELQHLIINSSCRIKTTKAIHHESFDMRVNGTTSADMVMKVNSFNVEGPGAITLVLNGYASKAGLAIQNLGGISAEELITDTCTVKMGGTGNISTYVTSQLNVDISGSGDVTFNGHDTLVINEKISGSGTLIDLR